MPAPIKKCYFGVQRFSLVFCLMVLLAVGCSDNSSSDNSSDTKSTAANNSTAGSANKSNAASKAGGTEKSGTTEAPAPKKIVVSTEPDINEPEFHEALLAAVNDYLQYGMVNSIALAAPTDCRPPGAPKPLMSESEHESSHGNKLYFLFAKDIGHYVNPGGKPAPVGQVVVKESWTSSPAHPGARNLVKHASGNRVDPRAKVGNQTLEIGQRENFFVMTKLAEDTPKTDKGWVYGVIDADTRKVIGSGKIASCMSCHVEEETNDRLYGSKHFSFGETIVSEVEVSNETVTNPEPVEEMTAPGAIKKETTNEESPAKKTPELPEKESPDTESSGSESKKSSE